jgi:hypothetical protein
LCPDCSLSLFLSLSLSFHIPALCSLTVPRALHPARWGLAYLTPHPSLWEAWVWGGR